MTSASITPRYDVERIREDFPILKTRVNGSPLAYLDNASTTQKPAPVIEATSLFYEESYSNVHRGVHALSVKATDAYEEARAKAARFINCTPEEAIFVRGTTEAINLVAQTYGRTLKPGDEILITEMEHHSNIVPWQILCQETGAVLRVAPMSDDGNILLDKFSLLLNRKTKIVSFIHISNVLGTVNPAKEMTRLAHDAGAKVLVDGAQSVPHASVDVQDIGCDFFAFSGHKVYGPTGIGVLFGKSELLAEMSPYQGGGDMILSVSFDKTTYSAPPHRFEAGTPNIAGAIGLGTAIDYVNGIGISSIAQHEAELTSYASGKLSEIGELRIIGTSQTKASVISFVVDGIHPHDIGTILDQQGVAIRAGHHCAQPLMERLGIPATARASLAMYNTHAEIDALADGIRKAIEVFA